MKSMEVKEIIVFSEGDSREASTWSNVPCLFTKALEDKGIVLRRINLLPVSWPLAVLAYCYDKLAFSRYFREFFPAFCNSGFFWKFIAEPKIKKAVKKYKSADFCLFFKYKYHNKYNNIPSVLFSDWTHELELIDRYQIQPSKHSLKLFMKEKDAISNAEFVFSMFPKSAVGMSGLYPQVNIRCLGCHLVNNMYDGELIPEEILEKKRNSKELIFIGSHRYKDSALLLVNAFLKSELNDYKLNIIGLNDLDCQRDDKRVVFHGYLSKNVFSERKKYYELLIRAKLICNVSPRWAGFSSMTEAMYFYTPVLISPYTVFTEEFGTEISFGLYNSEFSEESVARQLEEIARSERYENMCLEAHEAVKDYSYDNYIDQFLEELTKA